VIGTKLSLILPELREPIRRQRGISRCGLQVSMPKIVGQRSGRGRNYLIPIDATLEHVKDVGWETAAIDDLMVGLEEGSGLRLIILDACRDNPFRSRMISTRTLSRGLALVEPPSNDIVAYSSEHGRVALDGTSSNSPYAAALLTYLERPGLEIAERFREVRDHVKEMTGSRQKPHTYGQLGRRKYYLTPPLDADLRMKHLGQNPQTQSAGVEGNLLQSIELEGTSPNSEEPSPPGPTPGLQTSSTERPPLQRALSSTLGFSPKGYEYSENNTGASAPFLTSATFSLERGCGG
jgi:hypothetical protein